MDQPDNAFLSTGVWQGEGMESLKFYLGSPYPRLLPPAGGSPPNGLMAVWGVAHPQGGRAAAVFFPFGHPMPYASVSKKKDEVKEMSEQ
jgi:hypothetical protein